MQFFCSNWESATGIDLGDLFENVTRLELQVALTTRIGMGGYGWVRMATEVPILFQNNAKVIETDNAITSRKLLLIGILSFLFLIASK